MIAYRAIVIEVQRAVANDGHELVRRRVCGHQVSAQATSTSFRVYTLFCQGQHNETEGAHSQIDRKQGPPSTMHLPGIP